MTIDKRINFRGGGKYDTYQGGSKAPGSAEAIPNRITYTSENIDSKPVTGNDYRRSENEFIDNFNQNEASRFEPTFFNRNYDPTTLDQFGSSNQPRNYGNAAMGGILSLINPALSRVYSGYNFLKDMVPQFNQDVRSTPQMFKFDPTNFNKIDNGLTGIESIQTVGSNSLDTNNGLQGMTIQEIQELINNANSSNLSNTQGSM